MKHLKHLIVLFLLTFSLSIANWYIFGIKSADNTITNIVEIQNKYNFDFKIIWFIFDPWTDDIIRTMNNLNNHFWTGKIYHITISPNSYSAKQVAEWIFDEEYKKFFQTVKQNDLKVIFRTMHEMNWWRYPRWSNPEQFKQARIHVRELSREEWLDQNNILFDFSVNHWDMPTKGTPSQSASLITCNQKNKFKTIENKIFIKTWYKEETITKKVPIEQSYREKLTNKPIKYKTVTEKRTVAYPIYETTTEKVQNCYTFEDYYPWKDFVDIMWVTFYNRWKATYSRQRYSPDRILNDTNRDTLTRLRSFNKPIFIDEVWTTAVRYTWSYSQAKSQESYQNDYENKNFWLTQLKDFMNNNPEIIGMTYFNVDYTNWLTNRIWWEADRSIINLNNWKFYEWVYELYNNQSNDKYLKSLFQEKQDNTWNKEWVKENTNKTTINITQKQKNDLADLMIEKFWKDESIRRINKILRNNDNENLVALLKDLKEIINSK